MAWIAEFVEDDGSGGYNVIARPEWLTAFTASGNGGTSATTFPATVMAQQGVTSNAHNEVLQSAAPVSGTYDLSTKGGTTAMNTANCYAINAPGSYSLPLVYGNAIKEGNENFSAYLFSPQKFVNHLDMAIGNPYIYNNANCTPNDAVLVWQDEENLVTNVRLSPDKHNLIFDVPQATIKQGNAIVAVRDKDSRIMWSWHIWVTDFVPGLDPTVEERYDPVKTPRDKVVTNYQGAQYTFMGANIGWCDAGTTTYDDRSVKVRFTQAETGSTQVITLTQASHSVVNSGNQTYFQFGRKDPMLGAIRDVNGSTVDKTFYPGSYSFDKSGTGKVTIGTSIQNRMYSSIMAALSLKIGALRPITIFGTSRGLRQFTILLLSATSCLCRTHLKALRITATMFPGITSSPDSIHPIPPLPIILIISVGSSIVTR